MANVVVRRCDAVIFDLDGVLINSRAAIETAWRSWQRRTGIAWDRVQTAFTGRRSRDVIGELAPHLDVEEELRFVLDAELTLASFVLPLPGARELIAKLPTDRWGIVTSGQEALARARLTSAGLPVPGVFVTAETVMHGKPHPEPYWRAAELLRRDPVHCVVFEDAPDGLRAARAAGCYAVGVLGSFAPDGLDAAIIIRDLAAVRSRLKDVSLLLEMTPIRNEDDQ